MEIVREKTEMEILTEKISTLENEIRELKELLRRNFPFLLQVTTPVRSSLLQQPTPVTSTPIQTTPVTITSPTPVTITSPTIEIIQNSMTDLRSVSVKDPYQRMDARIKKFAENPKKKRQAQEDQRKGEEEEEENARKRQKNV